MPESVFLDEAINSGEIVLGRGNIISSDDLTAFPGDYPVYSSSAKGTGEFGRYGKYMFDEELITWSVDGGGRPFHRKTHRFSVTNVCGYLKIRDPDKWNYRYLQSSMEIQQSRISFDYQMKAHPSVIRKLYSFRPLPIDAQRRIAEILSVIDEAIEHTEALIAKTQQIKAGLMHDLFTRGVLPNGQLRPPRSEAPDLYKESPLGWIPKEWGISHLPELRQASRPHLKTGPFGSSLKQEHWVEHGIPVITIGALGEGCFEESELLFIAEHTASILSEYRVINDDIVFSRVADVGRSVVVGADQTDWIMSSNLMRISIDSSKMSSHFLQSLLAYDHRIRGQIRRSVNSGGREVANSAILNALSFPTPMPDEQLRITARASAIDRERGSLIKTRAKLSVAKQGLMHDLLSGAHDLGREAS